MSHIEPPLYETRMFYRRTPAAASRRRQVRRCYRCGKAKAGVHHSGRAKSNAVEYCTVPEEERTQFWRVPPGYGVGDTCAKEHKRDIAREWKNILEEKQVADHGWEDWHLS